jgi:hypothetical protein
MLREPRPRFHDLRHTFASLLIAQGADVVFVSGQIGHADAGFTLRVYAHLFEQAQHAETTRQLLEAEFGNALETGAWKSRSPLGRQPLSLSLFPLQTRQKRQAARSA